MDAVKYCGVVIDKSFKEAMRERNAKEFNNGILPKIKFNLFPCRKHNKRRIYSDEVPMYKDLDFGLALIARKEGVGLKEYYD